MIKIDWNNPEEVRKYSRNYYRIKHNIPLDKPVKIIKKLNIDWNNRNEVNEYQRNYHRINHEKINSSNRKRHRVKHNIPLDAPVKKYKKSEKRNIDWNNPEEVRKYQRNWSRIKNNISLDKPVQRKRKINLDWNDHEQVNIYRRKCHKIKKICDPTYYEYTRKNGIKTRLKKYGLTIEDQEKMLQIQKNKCLICGCNLKNKKFCIDHDHVTGGVRGILCNNCNAGIGLLGDNLNGLIKAVKYLLNFEKINPN